MTAFRDDKTKVVIKIRISGLTAQDIIAYQCDQLWIAERNRKEVQD